MHRNDQIRQEGIAAITTHIPSTVTKLINTSFSGYFTRSLHYRTQTSKSPSSQTKDAFLPIFKIFAIISPIPEAFYPKPRKINLNACLYLSYSPPFSRAE